MQRIIFLLLLLPTLAGCGAKENSSPAVSFMVFGDPAEVAAYQTLVDRFREQYPTVEIQLQHVPGHSEYRQKLAAQFSAGAPPDVMLLNYRRFAAYAAADVLEPLGSYLAASSTLQANAFYSPTLEAFTYQEQLWCVPQNISSLVVYYNRDLFDAANLPYPATGWTRADMLHYAQTLTIDLDGDGRPDQYGVGISPNLFRLAPFVWQNGAELVDDPLAPTRLALDSPAALDAFRWLVDLQVTHQVAPDAAAEAAGSSENRFLNGRLAMIFNSRRGVPTYRTIDSFAWDVAPLPAGDHPAGILHSDAYCLSAAAQNKEAAWQFIEFANSPAGQQIMATTGRTVPSLHSVAESAAFLNPDQPPANSQVFLDVIPTLRRVPLLPTWPGIEETTSREIARAFYGQATVDEAARSAIEMSRPYFERARQP